MKGPGQQVCQPRKCFIDMVHRRQRPLDMWKKSRLHCIQVGIGNRRIVIGSICCQRHLLCPAKEQNSPRQALLNRKAGATPVRAPLPVRPECATSRAGHRKKIPKKSFIFHNIFLLFCCTLSEKRVELCVKGARVMSGSPCARARKAPARGAGGKYGPLNLLGAAPSFLGAFSSLAAPGQRD